MKVYLFPTCLIRTFFPDVLHKSKKLLQNRNCEVFILNRPFCCGQIYFNSGNIREAKVLSKYLFKHFKKIKGTIVIPSGSCTHYLKTGFEQTLLKEQKIEWGKIKKKIYEFSDFFYPLLKEIPYTKISDVVFFHPSCHSLRGLKIKEKPVRILEKNLNNLKVGRETCCGFGGFFSVKMPLLSSALMDDKIKEIEESKAQIISSLDPGCLLQLEGGLLKKGIKIKVMHFVEVLSELF